MEAMLVAAVTATVSFTMIYFSNDCQPLDSEHAEEYPLQVLQDSQYRKLLFTLSEFQKCPAEGSVPLRLCGLNSGDLGQF